MSLRGNLQTMPLAEILQWISVHPKTGILQIQRAEVSKDIFFEKGKIVSSGSNDPREYMGQFFISFGKLTEEDVVKAYKVQKETQVYLGKILVMIGKVSEAQVQKVLLHKTRESILDCFLWEEGNFNFTEKPKALVGQQVEISLETKDLLNEGAERQKEWNAIRATIPSAQVSLNPCPEKFPAGFPEKADDKKLMNLLAAQKKIPEICYEFHMGEFLVTKKIFQLINQGILKVNGASPTTPLPAKKSTSKLDDLFKQGKSEFEQGNFAKAQETLKQLLDIAPAHEDANLLHGKAREQLIARLDKDLDENAIPKMSADLNKLNLNQFDVQEGFVLSRVNGTWAIREIVQICPFPKEKVLAALQRFVKEKVISLSPPPVLYG